MILPTQEILKARLHYNPETGIFIWRSTGKKAGTLSKGYTIISFNDRLHSAHQLVWLYVYGKWPRLEIDHIDRDKNNNKLDNLREVTHKKNMMNRNPTPLRGISKNRHKYRVALASTLIGYYRTLEEAMIARDKALEELL